MMTDGATINYSVQYFFMRWWLSATPRVRTKLFCDSPLLLYICRAQHKKTMLGFNHYITQFDYSWIIDFMTQNGTLMQYRRGEMFCFAGHPCKTLGFIRKGAFIYSAQSMEGDRHVVGYAFENSFVCDYAAFRLKEPSNVDITALMDSDVYLVTYDRLNRFITKNTENRDHFLRITEILYSDIYQLLLASYTHTAEERYAEVLHRCPEIFNHTTLKDLASYLHITPETLSRIRTKLKEG